MNNLIKIFILFSFFILISSCKQNQADVIKLKINVDEILGLNIEEVITKIGDPVSFTYASIELDKVNSKCVAVYTLNYDDDISINFNYKGDMLEIQHNNRLLKVEEKAKRVDSKGKGKAKGGGPGKQKGSVREM